MLKALGLCAVLTLSVLLAGCNYTPVAVKSDQTVDGFQNTTSVAPPIHVSDEESDTTIQPTFEVDLRQTSLDHLSTEQRRRLSEEPAVRVTLSDGTVLDYQNDGNMMLLEGDIAIGPSGQVLHYLQQINAKRFDAQSISSFAPGRANWPNHTIPYYWQSGVFTPDQEQALRIAIQRWNEQAGDIVKWKWGEHATPAVQFVRSHPGVCGWSSLGSVGGRQAIAINCFNIHTIIHEMGHAAGLWHEHQRCDRDKYVTIPVKYRGINFNRYCYGHTYGPYDYDSVMSYGRPFVTTLSAPKGPYQGHPENLGRGKELSAGDIFTLRSIYGGNKGN